MYNIIAVCMIFFISMRTVFSQKNKEQKILSLLYKILWIRWFDVECFAETKKRKEKNTSINANLQQPLCALSLQHKQKFLWIFPKEDVHFLM